MAFKSGWARLALVFVALVEIVLGSVALGTKMDLDAANERLAGLAVPPPEVDEGEMTADYFLSIGNDPIALIERQRDRTLRYNYDLAVGNRNTARNEMFLAIGFMAAWPLVALLLFQTSAWVINGFRGDGVPEEESGYI